MCSVSQPYFSIIVPVYNVEKYLEQCIDSILVQTYNDYELILVDDGSPDSSGEICDRYAVSNPRIRVIHKKNGGLSSARNAGVENSRGKYIFFIDSDDYLIYDNAFQELYNIGEDTNADIIMYGITKYFEEDDRFESDTTNVDVSLINSKQKTDVLKYLIENNIYKADACTKITKRDIILSHRMKFKDGYYSEDMDWCGDLLIYAKTFAYYNSHFYVYRLQRKGAITNTNSNKLVEDKLYMCAKGFTQLSGINDAYLKECLGSYYAYEYAVCLGISYNVSSKDLLKKIKDNSGLLEYDISKKVKKVNKVRSLFGFNLTRFLLGVFVRLKN